MVVNMMVMMKMTDAITSNKNNSETKKYAN